jgi:hypothetical protein
MIEEKNKSEDNHTPAWLLEKINELIDYHKLSSDWKYKYNALLCSSREKERNSAFIRASF